MSEGRNRRRFRRVPFAFPVAMEDLPGREAACQRIATAGAWLYTPFVLPDGEEVRLSFTLPQQDPIRVVVNSRILRGRREDAKVRTLGGVQVLFLDLDPHDEAVIQQFVLRCLQREAEYKEAHAESGDTARRRVVPVRFFGTETDQDTYVVDISEGGVFLRSLSLPEQGERVFTDLYLPGAGAITRVAGRVVWRREHDPSIPGRAGFGVQFLDLSEDVARLIRAFVDIFGTD